MEILNGAMSLGDFAAFNMFLNYLYQSSGRLASVLSSITQSMAASQRVFELLQMSPENSKQRMNIQRVTGEIIFKNVEFKYPDKDELSLHNINLKINPGEFVAIAGKTGSGKSTLLKLLMRFYKASGGEILIDGINILEIKEDSYRKHIILIPQEIYLFSTSIYENLKLVNNGSNWFEIEKACRLSHAHDFIINLEKRYETEIGERGIKLSGGERQRLAIARAILVDPSVLLMDEATAYLDPDTERRVLLNLKAFFKGKTMIISAHRKTPLLLADRVLLLEKGRLLAEGKHKELLRKSQEYYKIFKEIEIDESKKSYE